MVTSAVAATLIILASGASVASRPGLLGVHLFHSCRNQFHCVGPLAASSTSTSSFSSTMGAAGPQWRKRIDRLVAGYEASVVVADDGRILYSHDGNTQRSPASNQKLLLSMALLDVFGPRDRITTAARATEVNHGVVAGDLWVRGEGDPSITSGHGYGASLEMRPTRIRRLARKIQAEGVQTIEGSVMGSTTYFDRDWNARGWQPYVPARFAPLASALAYDGNATGGLHIRDPERRFARTLTEDLEGFGVEVTEAPGAGRPPGNLVEVTSMRSATLWRLVGHMNHQSSNFFAEMLGKRLGAEVYGSPGTISKGARAIRRWAADRGAEIEAYDSSGLSYADRLSPAHAVRLLAAAEAQPWARALRRSLPRPGEGTLAGRLDGLEVRAKTGSHFNGDSALSGWVRLRHGRAWVEFSILSVGLPQSTEDEIVRTVATFARSPHRAQHPGPAPSSYLAAKVE